MSFPPRRLDGMRASYPPRRLDRMCESCPPCMLDGTHESLLRMLIGKRYFDLHPPPFASLPTSELMAPDPLFIMWLMRLDRGTSLLVITVLFVPSREL